jgi:hypothetical protein
MKPWSTSRFEAKSTSIFVRVALVITVAVVLQSGCKSSPVIRPSAIATAKPPNQPLRCPAFGATLPPTPNPPTGAHKVILSWKASAPADSTHSAAVGYCVYRGTDPKALPSDLLNPVPFTAGTTCTDNSVQNGKDYYYVVRAISAGNAYSKPSNPAHAPVPSTPGSSASAISAALCQQ